MGKLIRFLFIAFVSAVMIGYFLWNSKSSSSDTLTFDQDMPLLSELDSINPPSEEKAAKTAETVKKARRLEIKKVGLGYVASDAKLWYYAFEAPVQQITKANARAINDFVKRTMVDDACQYYVYASGTGIDPVTLGSRNSTIRNTLDGSNWLASGSTNKYESVIEFKNGDSAYFKN